MAGQGAHLGDWQFPQQPPGPIYGGRRRRVINVSGRSPWPRYLAWVVVIVAALLVARLAWQGSRYFSERQQPAAKRGTAGPSSDGSNHGRVYASWERDMLLAINQGVQDAGAGRMDAAEEDVDRMASMATEGRLASRAAQPEFYEVSLGGLDRILTTASSDADMMDHVTQARVALAELRSSENDAANSEATSQDASPISTSGRAAKRDTAKVSIDAPRELAADSLLDPSTLGGKHLDATFMPDTAEVLLPPATRAFADNVRVENLTIEGAAQTLDGIHWRNVTFVGTHLRYESGELDLDDVRFVSCRFGFPSDESGARLANAIALGKTSIKIEHIETQPTTP
ncbi:MAG TPA: hypothetical protein VMD78_10545 [Candidatus Baltobacteraceae bacterium]|nr:hypothetical protein [Candidatus Baltobacteraceae bacterium]